MKESIKRVIFLSLWFCLLTLAAFGQSDEQNEDMIVIDDDIIVINKESDPENLHAAPINESQADLRTFDTEKLEAYRRSGRFNYDDDPEYESNWLSKVWLIAKRWFNDMFGKTGGNILSQIFKWSVIVLGIGFLLYFLLQATGNSIIKKERKDKFLHLETLDQSVSEQTLDQLLEAAIANGEHRAVIRLYFLKCLRKLDDNEEIVWRDNKTNYEYSNELKRDVLSAPFAELISIYEHVWYGEFDVNQSEYETYSAQFKSFLEKITRTKV